MKLLYFSPSRVYFLFYCLIYDIGFHFNSIDVTLDTLKAFVPTFLRNIYIECLFTGNMLQEDAVKVSESIERTLVVENKACPMLPVQHIVSREYHLPDGKKSNIFYVTLILLILHIYSSQVL